MSEPARSSPATNACWAGTKSSTGQIRHITTFMWVTRLVTVADLAHPLFRRTFSALKTSYPSRFSRLTVPRRGMLLIKLLVGGDDSFTLSPHDRLRMLRFKACEPRSGSCTSHSPREGAHLNPLVSGLVGSFLTELPMLPSRHWPDAPL